MISGQKKNKWIGLSPQEIADSICTERMQQRVPMQLW